MRSVDTLSRVLLIVGGLNWGLVGLFKFDLVAWICGGLDFGQTNAVSRIVYVLVGVAAVCQIALLPALISRTELRHSRPAPR
jgi:uncharacterized membrane protein YuzA (DUF378 family)